MADENDQPSQPDIFSLLNELIIKVDGLDSRLDSVDKTLVKQEENLKLHMYRTDLNEKATAAIVEELKPIKKHVNFWDAAFKIIGVVFTIAGLAASIISAMHK